MKKSKFNVIDDIGVNKKLIFNSFTGILAELNEEYMKIFDDIENLNIKELENHEYKIIQNLEKNGFIVRDNKDELARYIELSEKQKNSNKTLKIVIAPTLECNFACSYCYETQEKGCMSRKTQESLIQFVYEIIEKQKIKEVSVIWYGGEPLLCIEIIKILAKKIIKICKEKSIKYTSGIVTNGYLLDKKSIDILLESHVTSAQITLDGTAEYHNKKRVLFENSTKGTFDQIVKNINLITKERFFVSIRMNVDRKNLNNMKALIDELDIKLINKDKVNITFAPIFKNDNIKDSNDVLKKIDFSKFQYEQMVYAIEKGFKRNLKSMYPKGKLNYCSAVALNSYVINPNGDIFKCWNDVCIKEKSIGHIENYLQIKGEELNLQVEKWENYSILNNFKCKRCNILPICGGGCPREKVHLNKMVECEQIKYNIKKIMKYYKKRKMEDK